MMERLVKLLGVEGARQWIQTPIQEWQGFTVADMFQYGLYSRVTEWFQQLTDQEILTVSREKSLFLESSIRP